MIRALHLNRWGTHLYIVNVVEIRVLHFFDVTLRNSTSKICKHDCRGAAVLARDDVRARRGDERRPRLALVALVPCRAVIRR